MNSIDAKPATCSKSRTVLFVVTGHIYTHLGTVYKRGFWDVPQTWVAILAHVVHGPFFLAKYGIWMCRLFAIFLILRQNLMYVVISY